MRPTYVAVCGPGVCSPEEAAGAEEIGRLLAEAGVVVVTGGLGGVMAAASKGAREAGGTVLGILPGEDQGAANPHCTLTVPTGLGEARNALVVRTADALVAVGGEYGTLSEIALALKKGIAVVGLGTWELRKPADPSAHVRAARDPREAAAIAVAAARSTVNERAP